MSKYKVIGMGELCPKCGKDMEKRSHSDLQTSHLNKVYYFTEWDYCQSCKHVQHYDDKKVWSNTKQAKIVRNIQASLEETERQQSFIKSI